MIPPSVVQNFLGACRNGGFSAINIAATDAIAAGFPANQLLANFTAALVKADNITDKHKAAISIRIAEADKKLTDGADEFLQLLDVLSYASKTLMS